MTQTNISRKGFLRTAGLAGVLVGLGVSCKAEEKERMVSEAEMNLRFLFQGDSITDGNRGRNEDPNHIMGHGYAFSVASRIGADFPNAGFTFFNRGISGNTVPDLIARWQTDTLDLKPDVLSLLVGINDVGNIVGHWREPQTLEEFASGYKELLDRSLEQNPKLMLVLGLPFVYAVGARKQNWEIWKNETQLRAEVVQKLAAEYNAVLIDYPALFEKAAQKASIDYWIWDGVHPTVFGHELMAREWIKQVSARLDFLSAYKFG
jgi:lysophospholipase L1-like esterase